MPDSGTVQILPSETLAYLDKGFSVIPLRPGSKKPAIPWKRFQGERLGKEALARLSMQYANCNWAIVTGEISGLVVLDFDSPGALSDARQRGLPEGPRVKTPRGYHCYFRYPGRRVPSSAGLMPNLDVRADKGYIVAPPSKFSDGSIWRWEVSLDEVELPDLPDWFWTLSESRGAVDGASNAPAPCDPGAITFADVTRAPANPTDYALHTLQEEIAKFAATPEGGRNDQLNATAYSLGQIISTGALDQATVQHVLCGAAKGIGLGDGELSATIKSGLAAGMKEPKWETAPRFELLSVEELKALSDPSWLIDGIIPQGALAILYGKPGTGKSFIALDWACSVSTGRQWLGRDVKQGGVVYICAEGASGYKKRVMVWEVKKAVLTEKPIWFLRGPVALSDKVEIQEFCASIRATSVREPRLIVVDTLARCFGDGDENTAKDMNAFVRGIDTIRTAFPSASILVVHHSGKDGDRGARGSTALRGACDTELKLAGGSGAKDRMTLSCGKQKDAEPFKPIILRRRTVALSDNPEMGSSCVIEAANVSTLEDQENRIPVPQNSNDLIALNVLAEKYIGGMAWTEWWKATGLGKGTFKRCPDRLIKRGSVVKEGKVYRVVNRLQSGSTTDVAL